MRARGAVRGIGARLGLFLAILGPGVITANVDNDAGGITTYSQAGSRYGLATLWIFLPLCLALIVVQEMSNRMGVVSGKGLSDLIRERFGVKITFYLMAGLLVTNFGNILAEFAGVAAAGEIFGVPRWVAVPIAALFVWAIVLRSSYRTVEKVFLVACTFYISYIVAGAVSHPPAGEVAHALLVPHLQGDADYLIMLIALVGTTIAPWMQFYQQAAVVEKNIRVEDYYLSRIDTIVGCLSVTVVAVFIVVVCSTNLHAQGMRIESAADAARGLAPIAGRYASLLFAFGLLNASVFAASILPLSTSYTICESFGWESGISRSFDEAREFYILYTALIAIGAGAVLIPKISLLGVMYVSQVVNGMVLPIVLVFMLILITDRRIMGERTNSLAYNIACILLCAALAVLAIGSAVLVLIGK
ncbi:MAG: Nramp family divalent metal transporter [Candidatus Eisenbacteria bacterium]|nr:Nramp family divalent metal transporter [Candidatus Eisenbacteria bacterium]